MQFAERPRAAGMLALCSALALAAATLAIGPRRIHHRDRHPDRARISFDTPRCREWIPPPAPEVSPPPLAAPLTYDGVLAAATPLFARCFAHDGAPTELLVTIAPDGRVRATTSRPEPETHTSRCLAGVVRGLVFPAAPTTVMMRVPLAPR